VPRLDKPARRSTAGPSGIAAAPNVAEALMQVARAEAIATITTAAREAPLASGTSTACARRKPFRRGGQPIEHCPAWRHGALKASSLDADALLEAGMPRDLVEVVALLTRRPLLFDDADYYERIRGNRRALRVLAADINDGAGS
jgi:hypothetical protein